MMLQQIQYGGRTPYLNKVLSLYLSRKYSDSKKFDDNMCTGFQ